jgi:hypothetical protein
LKESEVTRTWPLALALLLAACASSEPSPNTARAEFVRDTNVIQVKISDVQPATSALLVAPDGSTYPAAGINVVRTPYTAYNPPPSVGIGIGGFGGNFGTGVGLGLPLGGPTPAYSSDQFVTSVVFAAPADYAQNWAEYRVQVQLGNRNLTLPAPNPTS